MTQNFALVHHHGHHVIITTDKATSIFGFSRPKLPKNKQKAKIIVYNKG